MTTKTVRQHGCNRLTLASNEHPITGGRYVIGARKRTNRAVCWASAVDGAVLRSIFEEVDALGLARPVVIYGHTCAVSETKSFRFEQVSGAVSGFAVYCEKCSEPIEGEVFQWKEDGGRDWTRLCWPCKKPMMDAALPRALAQVKRHFESPAVQKAVSQMLSGEPKGRS